MDLIERLMKLKYSYKKSEELYLEYAEDDNLIDLEILIMDMEKERQYV